MVCIQSATFAKQITRTGLTLTTGWSAAVRFVPKEGRSLPDASQIPTTVYLLQLLNAIPLANFSHVRGSQTCPKSSAIPKSVTEQGWNFGETEPTVSKILISNHDFIAF